MIKVETDIRVYVLVKKKIDNSGRERETECARGCAEWAFYLNALKVTTGGSLFVVFINEISQPKRKFVFSFN